MDEIQAAPPHPMTPQSSFSQKALGPLARCLGPVLLMGAFAAFIGFLYLTAMWWLFHHIGPEHWTGRPWALLAVLSGAGLAAGLLMRWLGSPGSVELMVDNIHVSGGMEGLRELRCLIPVSLLCIGAGGGMGPEAPLVQTTGSIGSWLADRRRLSMEEKRILTITGMAAGFTVLFGTPLGSTIFALEILHRRGLEYYEALLPAVIGSLFGYGVYIGMRGIDMVPVWSFPAPTPLRPQDLLWAVGAGVAGAGVAVAFTYANSSLEPIFHRVPDWVRPCVGGLVLGLLALASPYALTFGEVQLNGLVGLAPALGVFALAAAAKFLGSSVTLSSGWKGGFIIPLFFMGAALGRLGHAAFPGCNEVVLMAALMAAANTGVTKTPIGSALVVAGMTGMRLLPTTLIAAVIALLLTGEAGLIDSQRSRVDVNA